jgi:hypothetical protein
MNMNETAQICRKACRGEAGKGFVHDRDGAYLFFGEFVGPLKIVDLDFAGVGSRTEIFRLGVSGVYRGEKLIYFFLGQNFCHYPPVYFLPLKRTIIKLFPVFPPVKGQIRR